MIIGFIGSHPRADLEGLSERIEDGSPHAVLDLAYGDKSTAGKRYATQCGHSYSQTKDVSEIIEKAHWIFTFDGGTADKSDVVRAIREVGWVTFVRTTERTWDHG